MESSQAAKQNVFRRPASYTPQSLEAGDGGVIRKRCHGLQIETSSNNCRGKLKHRAGFLTAESKFAQGCWRHLDQIMRARKCVRDDITRSDRLSTGLRQPIEELDADRQRQLLAGDGVDYRLENAFESGWLHAVKTQREGVEWRLARDKSVERSKIQFQPK
jgi:hypothetical protein